MVLKVKSCRASTFAPVAPRARAIDRPMPLDEPVTTQTGLSTASSKECRLTFLAQ